ncbi:hypothetical protein N7456_010852 [Penicillium angulare]|uniref:Uncharacterized protein n=1 Tax=Penicillium angulare TaxID=116970 RepID=A0A9W9ESU9_9EURO|nr:hypothetical protein N7456_010852 [Penicillium angulare]
MCVQGKTERYEEANTITYILLYIKTPQICPHIIEQRQLYNRLSDDHCIHCDHHVPTVENETTQDRHAFELRKDEVSKAVKLQKILHTTLLERLPSWKKEQGPHGLFGSVYGLMPLRNNTLVSRTPEFKHKSNINPTVPGNKNLRKIEESGNGLQRKSRILESALKEGAELVARRGARGERWVP